MSAPTHPRDPLSVRFASLQRCPIPGHATAHERRAYATRVLDIVIQAADFPALTALHDAAAAHVRLILDT